MGRQREVKKYRWTKRAREIENELREVENEIQSKGKREGGQEKRVIERKIEKENLKSRQIQKVERNMYKY